MDIRILTAALLWSTAAVADTVIVTVTVTDGVTTQVVTATAFNNVSSPTGGLPALLRYNAGTPNAP